MKNQTKKLEAMKCGFSKGYNQLSPTTLKTAKDELYTAVGVNNRVSFSNYKNGQTILNVDQIIKLEEVFKKYNITDIWGNDDED